MRDGRETRPSRPAVELVEGGEGGEERLAGNHVDVEARLLVVPVFIGEGALGPVSLGDAVLLGSQLRDRFGVFPVGRHSRYSCLFSIEDRHRVVDRPITSGYRNNPSGSTSEVFRSAGADSLAQVTVLTLLERAAPAALPSGYGEGVYEGPRYGVTGGEVSRQLRGLGAGWRALPAR